jgi:hypothetical protein
MAELTGGCGCGAVRFEISEPLLGAVYCHCTRCQRRTGAGHGTGAQVAPGSVTVTQGEELVRTWFPEGGLGKAFCGECGCHLYGQTPDGEIKGVRLGAIDGDPGIRPTIRQFVANAAVWEPVPDDGLTHYDGARPT